MGTPSVQKARSRGLWGGVESHTTNGAITGRWSVMEETLYMRMAAARAFRALETSASETDRLDAIELCCRFFPIDTIDAECPPAQDVASYAHAIAELLESKGSDDDIDALVDELWCGIVCAERGAVARGYARTAVLLETVIEPLLDTARAECDEAAFDGLDEQEIRGELLSRHREAQQLLFGS